MNTNFSVTPFDHRSDTHTQAITTMFTAYLIEEFDRTHEFAGGYPVAAYLTTITLWSGEDMIGFCSIDPVWRSVELIYIHPRHRHHGIARRILTDIKASCPQPIRLKGPVSPGGQALADLLGLGIAVSPQEQAATARHYAQLHRAINAQCHHRRGNPSRACRRCYLRLLAASAAQHVDTYIQVCNVLTPSMGVAA